IDIYTLSLHDALPISLGVDIVGFAGLGVAHGAHELHAGHGGEQGVVVAHHRAVEIPRHFAVVAAEVADLIPHMFHRLAHGHGGRSEEHTSELQSRENL